MNDNKIEEIYEELDFSLASQTKMKGYIFAYLDDNKQIVLRYNFDNTEDFNFLLNNLQSGLDL
jgi:hypothetical protein